MPRRPSDARVLSAIIRNITAPVDLTRRVSEDASRAASRPRHTRSGTPNHVPNPAVARSYTHDTCRTPLSLSPLIEPPLRDVRTALARSHSFTSGTPHRRPVAHLRSPLR
ncbi:hypothetical protein B0H10DRAFT_2234184 [Mycena sp. CBHHK59/15]|nr:hypothetical protein B0H10DRAFT_2234184 [Mycena sp. CBHHK59/15]